MPATRSAGVVDAFRPMIEAYEHKLGLLLYHYSLIYTDTKAGAVFV